jgi:hypothetical protein
LVSREKFSAMNWLILLALFGLVPGLSKLPLYQPVLYLIPILGLRLLDGAKLASTAWGRQVICLLCCILFFMLLLVQSWNGLQIAFLNEFARLCLPFIVALLSFQVFLVTCPDAQREMAMRVFVRGSLIILSIDCAARICEPLLNGSMGRYDYKYGGLFYSDSNFNGVIAGCIYCLIFDLGKSWRNSRIHAILLSLLSFSYGVYISLTAVIVWRYISRVHGNVRETTLLIAALFLISPVVIFGGIIFIESIFSNGSFLTKLEIVELVFAFYSNHIETIWTGLGSGQMREVLGWDSHNLVGLSAELGLVGSLTLLLLLLFLWSCSSYTSLFLTLVGGFSLFPVAYLAPIIFIALIKVASKSSIRASYNLK